ncbi:MAG TPA: F0F1 ATP synthase subunit B [Phycisphaerales bacterium]|nr:F0F1 ATP synthase subunit B [Phycisphaerales bacterium]
MHRCIQSLLVRTAPALSLALVAGAFAADEHGAKEASPIPGINEGLMTAVAAVLVFLVCATVMGLKVWPLIAKGLDERAAKIQGEIEAAEMARAQAKDALEQYQQSLSQARAEAQKEIDKARAQAQAIAAELKTKADAELNAMREKAMRDIDNAKRAAVSEVYAQGSALASTMAGKILKREVNTNDTQRLLDESVRQLEGARN